MTVRELIKVLEALPDEKKGLMVFALHQDDYYAEVIRDIDAVIDTPAAGYPEFRAAILLRAYRRIYSK